MQFVDAYISLRWDVSGGIDRAAYDVYVGDATSIKEHQFQFPSHK